MRQGSILFLWDDDDKPTVCAMLHERGMPFVEVKSCVVFESQSVTQMKAFRQALTERHLCYLLFFLENPDGSLLYANGVEEVIARQVKTILFPQP